MEPDLFKDHEWRRETPAGGYIISTSLKNFSIDWVNAAFESEDMYWAKSLPKGQISTMLSHSLNLGLFKIQPSVPERKTADSPSSPRMPSPTLEDSPSEQLQQVGMARFITDYITFAYLGDVYVDPDHRNHGLGKWLVKCCQEVIEAVPSLRRSILFTSPDVGKRFYSREMDFHDIHEESEYMCCMTRKAY